MKRIWLILVLLTTVGRLAWGQADGGLGFVESGVTLKLSAPISAKGERMYFLEVQTNDVYECANYVLEHDARTKGSLFAIHLKGVRRTNPCGQGMGPAQARIPISDLKPGNYKVRVTINRQIFRSKLTVADSSYDFRIGHEDPILFRIYNGHLNIIPDHVIWGKCEYVEPKKKQDALHFMKALEDAGAGKTMLPVGNYDEFYLHNIGTTEQKVIQGDHYEYPFVYSYGGDAAVLQEIMNAYRDKLKITLKNTKGQVFYNF